MKEHKWAEVLRAIADGKEVEFHGVLQWEKPKNINPISNPEYLWRIKPTKTPVDLSVLIDSGIDCCFWNFDEERKTIDRLTGIYTRKLKYSDGWTLWKFCRPKVGYWYSWRGGKYPLPKGFVVDVLRRDGSQDRLTHIEPAEWVHEEWMCDIIAFKVDGLADGYCYPWEIEE